MRFWETQAGEKSSQRYLLNLTQDFLIGFFSFFVVC